MKRAYRTLLPALALFVILTWFLWPGITGFMDHRSKRNDAAAFRDRLAKEIGEADWIELIEHSFAYDFRDVEGNHDPDSMRDIEYAKIRLTGKLKDEFAREVANMSEKPEDEFFLCGFEPHHSLVMSHGGSRQSRLSICFKCTSLSWDAVDTVYPDQLPEVLGQLIDRCAMRRHADWVALAKEAPVGNDRPPAGGSYP